MPGLVTETYLDTYVMGKLEKTELVSTTADNSVTQVVEYGTLVDSVLRTTRWCPCIAMTTAADT
ncbi:MAG: G5 domain-containing protein [Oscillospiraceae bacterium]